MITCKLISEVVCQSYDISRRELYSQRRSVGVVLPRQMSWYLAKTLTARSYPEIGRYMGGRDHTTVMHGVRRIGEAVINDPEISVNYETLVRQISQIGKAAESNDHFANQLSDLDPLAIASAVLDGDADETAPASDVVRILCMGLRHFADECAIISARVNEQASAIVTLEATRVRHVRAHQLHLELIERNKDVVALAETIAKAAKNLVSVLHTNGERPARTALESHISNLRNIFERT